MSWISAYCYSLAAKALLEGAGMLPAGTTTTSPTSTVSSTAPASTSSSSSSSGGGGSSGGIPRNFQLQVLSSNSALNKKAVTASNSYTFSIGGTTSSSCTGGTNCGSYPNTTTFTIANGYGDMFNGAGTIQAVFINSKTGALGYQGTSSAGAVPSGALMTGLVVRMGGDGSMNIVYNDGQDREWMACGSYIGINIVGQCDDGSSGETITLQAVSVNDPGAWAYGPA